MRSIQTDRDLIRAAGAAEAGDAGEDGRGGGWRRGGRGRLREIWRETASRKAGFSGRVRSLHTPHANATLGPPSSGFKDPSRRPAMESCSSRLDRTPRMRRISSRVFPPAPAVRSTRTAWMEIGEVHGRESLDEAQ
ncbi:hypothetical protein ZWY2020_037777 [Hordeum vulgare]|nr:hypothetical protein ZWY2020_037777 [Hordeum vulgare]